jgi:hypothetical protein
MAYVAEPDFKCLFICFLIFLMSKEVPEQKAFQSLFAASDHAFAQWFLPGDQLSQGERGLEHFPEALSYFLKDSIIFIGDSYTFTGKSCIIYRLKEGMKAKPGDHSMTSLSLNKELISSFPINIDPLIATKRVL